MSQLFGGYLYIPVKHSTPDELFLAILKQFGAVEIVLFYPRGPQKAQYVSLSSALPMLQKSGGRVEVGMGEIEIQVTYEPDDQTQQPYYFFEVSISDYLISYLEKDEQLKEVETFVQSWMECCKALEVEFAYFSKAATFLEPAYRNKMLAALEKRNLDALMEDAIMAWLMYFGPSFDVQAVQEAFMRAQKKQFQLLQYIKPQIVGERAVFLRMSRDASASTYEEP